MSIENNREKPAHHENPEKSPALIGILERILGAVEGFTERLLDQVSDHAEGLANRSVERLFGLLVLGAGVFFLLSGGAATIDYFLGIPGLGQMLFGFLILLVTALILLFMRRR